MGSEGVIIKWRVPVSLAGANSRVWEPKYIYLKKGLFKRGFGSHSIPVRWALGTRNSLQMRELWGELKWGAVTAEMIPSPTRRRSHRTKLTGAFDVQRPKEKALWITTAGAICFGLTKQGASRNPWGNVKRNFRI